MPGSHILEGLQQQARGLWRSRRRRLALAGVVLLLLCSLGLAAVVLQARPDAVDLTLEEIEMEVDATGEWEPPLPPPPPNGAGAPAEPERLATVGRPREVNAAWYDVPDDSLAKRRAGHEELTAAHNKLPLGTLVRVTHLSNGKSTLVRITDRGIRDKKVKLDVCREAAEELGMVSKGIARVKMEIVREEHGASPPESHVAAPLQ